METWRKFMIIAMKKTWYKDGADRRLHRIGGGECRRENEIYSK